MGEVEGRERGTVGGVEGKERLWKVTKKGEVREADDHKDESEQCTRG